MSRVLNGGHYVSPTALAAVNAAIARTGYVVNHHARSLVTQRSGSVAFILSEGDYTQESGDRATSGLLERAGDLDAVFVANDVMALGSLAALRRAGRRVPEDVAVGGSTILRLPWRRGRR